MPARRCKVCKAKNHPDDMISLGMGLVCSEECKTNGILEAIEKGKKSASKEYNKETARLKDKYESIGDCAEKLSQACNKAVRERDWDLNCISCYKPIRKVWKNYHAGHFIPYGSKYKYSRLRFDLRNINGQCCNCNSFRSGRQADYEVGLIERFGQQHVDDIKELKRQCDSSEVEPLSRQEMKDLTKHFRYLSKQFKEQRESL